MATSSGSATRRYPVVWNGEPRDLELPAERVAAELRFRDLPALPDPAAAILGALESPISAPPLRDLVRPGSSVAILVGDRMTDYMLGSRDGLAFPLLDHLNALGVRDRDVTIVYACGMHPHPQARERLGAALLSRVRLVEHEAEDDGQLAYMGTTSRGTPVWVNRAVAEADARIGVGEVSPVGPAGWCGGGKIVLPGVAGRDTIEQNHRMALSPEVRLGAIERNPIRQDMEEAAALARLDLKVDLLVNSDEAIVAVYAGGFREEWRAALPLAEAIWTTPMAPTDVAVVYPGDTRERYLSNPVYMTINIADAMTRPGGAIVLALSAAGGWSPAGDGGAHTPTREMFAQSAHQMARQLVRSQGSIRALHMSYMAKKVVEAKPVFLYCDGVADSEAKSLGFAGAFDTLAGALAAASEAAGGQNASLSAAFPRGIQWRMMPRLPR